MSSRRGPVLRTPAAAEYVGLKPQTLRKLKHLGEGPRAYKQGRLNVYYPDDLDAWLAGRLTAEAPAAADDAPAAA